MSEQNRRVTEGGADPNAGRSARDHGGLTDGESPPVGAPRWPHAPHVATPAEDEPGPETVRRDEEQTERQAPDTASPGEAAG